MEKGLVSERLGLVSLRALVLRHGYFESKMDHCRQQGNS